MTTNPLEIKDSDRPSGGPGAIVGVVALAVVLLLGVVFWLFFVEALSFGAPAGKPPTSEIQPVPVVQSIDQTLVHAPVVGEKAQSILQTIGAPGPDAGPQAVWRSVILYWGILLIATGILMLIIKRLLESTEDETTVMHLKGDTNISLRARGERG